MNSKERVVDMISSYFYEEGITLHMVEEDADYLVTEISISKGPRVDLLFRAANDHRDPTLTGLTAIVGEILTGLTEAEDWECVADSCAYVNANVRCLCFYIDKDSIYARYEVPAIDYFCHETLYGKLCVDLIREFQKELDFAFPVLTQRLYNRRPKKAEELARMFQQMRVTDEE